MPSSPTVPTLKMLFAVSGNLCAFPKCQNRLIEPQSGTLVGRVCHIKGKSEGPGSKRYDKNQSDEELHGVGNLIALCPIHHDVIDADEIAYTVERLLKMKSDHEAKYMGAVGGTEELAEKFAVAISHNIVNDGSIIHVQGLAGGQVAHTIYNVQDSNLGKPSRFESELTSRGLANPRSADFAKTPYGRKMIFTDQLGQIVPIPIVGTYLALTSASLVSETDQQRFFQWMNCNERRYEPMPGSFFLPGVVPDLMSNAYVWHNGEKFRFPNSSLRYYTYLATELDDGYVEYGYCPGGMLEPELKDVYYAKVIAGFVGFLRFLRHFAEVFGKSAASFSVGMALRGTTGTRLTCVTKSVLAHNIPTASPDSDGFRWVRESTSADWNVDELAKRAALRVLEHWSVSVPAWSGVPEFTDGKYTGSYFREAFHSQWH